MSPEESPQEEVVVEEVVEEPPQEVEVTEETLLECIADKVTLYGVGWNKDSQNARELFEGVDLNYVNCGTAECQGIQAYPTWVINGRTHLGRMSLEQLKLATDC